MPHAHTRHVLDLWRERRAPDRRPPARTELSLLSFGPLRPQMFVLAQGVGDWRVRSAGALLDDLHGRALAGGRVRELWAEADRDALDRVLGAVRDAEAPRVLGCRGETARGGVAAFELLLAPLTGPFGRADRCLGLLQPVTPLARLAGEPLAALHLQAAAPPAALRLVVDNTRPTPLV